MKKPSQNSRILRHLMKGKTLTPLQALDLFGTWRLSARIANLKDEGFKIVTDLITREDKTFASYSINEEYRPL